ncbi:hypothetical protein [Flavobacterium sp.]|jgi:hypothetical protein|uniref:hypothetical protein n=1 Tax=Flavobacterium sp. TaxID=239 RepID=UPI0037BF86C9
MKKIILITSLFIVFSCQKEKSEVFLKLEQYSKVRLLSYNHSRNSYSDKNEILIKDNFITISGVSFVDDVDLNTEFKNKIFNVLDSKLEYGTSADCYNPRHILLFYKKDKLVDFYEFCAECGGSYQSSGLKIVKSISSEQGDLLIEIFKELNLKNNGEETENYQYF